MNLYLDDLRPTPEGFERVYSYSEFGSLPQLQRIA